MGKKNPSRPEIFMILGDIVQDFGYIDREGFRIVKCRRQEAYGCGENGDAIMRGLALFVRLGLDEDNNAAKLCLSVSDEVFDRVGSEMDKDKQELYGRHLRFTCCIYAVDGNVMVLRISFIPSFSSAAFRSYYLVYDSAAASLFLLPLRPSSCRPICTTTPLKVVGQDGNYSLVLMADMSEEGSTSFSRKRAIPVLCLWSPPSPDDNGRNYNSETVWKLKDRVDAPPFNANLVFLFKGNAVWGDLAQGIMYCNCSDLMDSTEPVDFKHIMLPEECTSRTTDHDDVLDHCSLRLRRTMGCVGDSIWFVIIEPNFTCPGDTMVKVWTLHILSEDKWNLHREFKMQQVFRLMGLRETVPKFPIVRPQVDCARLYMLLPVPYNYNGGNEYGHLVCIDLSSRDEVRLQSLRRQAIPLMDHPLVLDRDFYDHLVNAST